MGNCHKNEFVQHSILDSTLFLLHINDLPDDYNCNITIYADNTTLYSKWEQASDLCQHLKLASTYRTLGQEVDFLFQCLKTHLVLSDQPNITAAIMLKWLGLFISKNHLLRSQRFSSKFNLGSHIIWIAKTASKKIGALICSMMFFFLQRLLCISLNLSYDLTWNIFVISELVHIAVGPSLAACLEPLIHQPNAASLSLLYRFSLVDIHLNWLNWSHLLTLTEGLLVIQIDRIIFMLPFLDVTKIPWCWKVSFFTQLDLWIICLWNALPGILYLQVLSKQFFCMSFIFVNPCVIVIAQSCMEWIPNYKKNKSQKWLALQVSKDFPFSM